MRILIEDVSILTMSTKHENLISRGYIYIDSGLIRGVGRGDPPEDLDNPDIVIGGRGKLAIPGLIVLFSRLAGYPFRIILDRESTKVKEMINSMSDSDLQLISTLSLAAMAMRGITAVLSVDRRVEPVVKAAETTGLRIIAAPCLNDASDAEEWSREIITSARRWHKRDNSSILITGSICSRTAVKGDEPSIVPSDMPLIVYGDACHRLRGEKVLNVDPPSECGVKPDLSIYTEEHMNLWRPGSGYGIAGDLSWSLSKHFAIAKARGFNPLDILGSATIWSSNKIGLYTGSIEPGRLSDIVILDISQPPWWIPIDLLNEEGAADIVVTGIPKIETVIVGNEIVIDGGELLTVGREIFSRAYSRVAELMGRR
jgi:cytosine/adenosine deaminase-related metal-dependent hydrolase